MKTLRKKGVGYTFFSQCLWFSCTRQHSHCPLSPLPENPQVIRYSVKHLNGRTNHRSLPVFFIFLFTYKPPKLSGTRDTKPDSYEALAPSARNMISAGWGAKGGETVLTGKARCCLPGCMAFVFFSFLVRSWGKVVLNMWEAFYPAMAALARGGGLEWAGRQVSHTQTLTIQK